MMVFVVCPDQRFSYSRMMNLLTICTNVPNNKDIGLIWILIRQRSTNIPLSSLGLNDDDV